MYSPIDTQRNATQREGTGVIVRVTIYSLFSLLAVICFVERQRYVGKANFCRWFESESTIGNMTGICMNGRMRSPFVVLGTVFDTERTPSYTFAYKFVMCEVLKERLRSNCTAQNQMYCIHVPETIVHSIVQL